MTLLGGLFSRRSKSNTKKKREDSRVEPDSAQVSPTSSDYVHVKHSPPPKLRLPFARKKQSVPLPLDSPTPLGRPSIGTNPPDLRRLRPPPSRSAIFAAYGDPDNALSTRSLPTDSTSDRSPPLFTWGKPEDSNRPDPQSFNLKSFRHVRPPSPTNVSNSSLTPPLPRPRGPSFTSDSSQRISVAAFREAQSRRSTAGSPVPDSAPNPPVQHQQLPPRSIGHISQQTPRSSLAVTSNSDSDSEASSSEHDSAVHVAKPSINHRPNPKPKAKSEIGHGHTFDRADKTPNLPPYRPPKSHLDHALSAPQRFSEYEDKRQIPDVPPRSQSSLGVYNPGVRPRASVSTSALSPTAAAKRANVLAASNSNLGLSPFPSPQLGTQPSRGSFATTHTPRPLQSESEDDSEDDAPLATLILPGRAASSMSSYSNLHSLSTGNITTRSTSHHGHTPSKPLIDINELTRPAQQRSYTSSNTAGFTEGPTLLSRQSSLMNSPRNFTASPPPMSPVSAPPWQSRTSADDNHSLTRRAPPVKFISPPASPAREKFQFISSTPDAENGNGAGVGRKLSRELNDSPAIMSDTSLEVRRDPITDRLTRAVKKNLQPPPGAGASSSSFVARQNIRQRSASREMSPSSRDGSDASRLLPQKSMDIAPAKAQQQAQTNLPHRLQMPFPSMKSTDEHSPPDDELAQLLGNAVQLISRTGNTPSPSAFPIALQRASSTSESSESEDDDEDDDDDWEKPEKGHSKDIAPIPIKQRSPAPSFSVTSRPLRSETGTGLGHTPRPRSSTLIETSSSSSIAFGVRNESISVMSSSHKSTTSTGNLIGFPNSSSGSSQTSMTDQRSSALKPPALHTRQRSLTMVTGVPLSAQMPAAKKPLNKPFAGARRNSPASSTGDSSSGRVPLTPRDGSDIGVGVKSRDDGNSKQHHQPQTKRHTKRRSVSFEDDLQDLKPPNRKIFIGGSSSPRGSMDSADTSHEDREEKRRERRRTEAKAAIELGNVINGKGPIMDDDDQDMLISQPIPPRMTALNPMMAMGNPMAMQMGFGGAPNLTPGAWGAQNMGMGGGGGGGTQQMLSPAQFMVPPPADPNFLAAHQRAMMIAKQAYQMAVAQQAMAAAADEWERGSAVGGFGPATAGGRGGSVYGVPAVAVGPPGMMQPQFGIMGMMQGGPGEWPASMSAYGASRSMYGGSQLGLPTVDGMMSSRSDYGGGTGGSRGGNTNNWSSSRSTYGESFGPAQDQYTRRGVQQQQGMRRVANNGRDSGYLPPPLPPMPAVHSANGSNNPDGRPRTKPGSPTSSRGPAAQRKAPPPSSWKLAM